MVYKIAQAGLQAFDDAYQKESYHDDCKNESFGSTPFQTLHFHLIIIVFMQPN